MVNNERALNLKAVGGLYAKPSTHINLPKSLITTSGLIKFKYEKHDIQAAFSGGVVDLRNTLAVGTKMRVANFWNGDHLSISVVKNSVNPDLTQDVDFKVRLDRGGDAMVFAHVASNYFTLKGSTFCGRSASHVVFDKVVRPLLEKKVAEDVWRKEVEEEEKRANVVIDLTDMDDVEVQDLLGDMYERDSKTEKRPRETGEEKQAVKRQHFDPTVVGLAARLQEIFPQVPLVQVQQRCHELLEGREDFGLVEHVYERLTEEFLQYRAGSFGEENRKETGTTPNSSDSVALPNLVNQIVRMEEATAAEDEQKATVKVEVKTEGGTDALQEVSNDPLLVGSVKSEVKEENEYVEAPVGISLQAQEGMDAREVKEEMMVAEGGSKKTPLGPLAFQRALQQRKTAPRRGIWKPSQELAQLLEIDQNMKISKASVLRLLWVRLEKQELLDPNDPRFFTPDEAMAGIFGPARIRATQMEKCVRDHLEQDKD